MAQEIAASSKWRLINIRSSWWSMKSASCFQMTAGKHLRNQPTDPSEQDRECIEHSSDQDDRRTRRNARVIGEQQAGIAGDAPAHDRNRDHCSDVARPKAPDGR